MTPREETSSATYSLEERRALLMPVLAKVYCARFLDDKMGRLVRQSKGGSFHLYAGGHELVGVMAAQSLMPGKDWALPYYRDRAFVVGLGAPIDELLGAFLARHVPHHSGGRMMPEHFSHKLLRIPCQSSCVGSQFLQAVGVARGIQLIGEDDVVYVSAGEGATSQGDFHEALNFSCLYNLGIIFVIQDNGWAISVPLEEQTAGGGIAAVARGYAGLSVFEVDGGSYDELDSTFSLAVAKAREGMGPTLIIAKVPRLGPHSSSDDPTKYKTPEQIAEEQALDPLPRLEAWAIAEQLVTADELAEMREEIRLEVDAASRRAEEYPFQDPSEAATKVFAPISSEWATEQIDTPLAESVVIVDALNHALREEMQRDTSVVVFGQDVAKGKGGVFGVTRGLTAEFGEERCFNTPLAESTIVALALGISLVGNLRPVAEVQFADYIWTGINQLFNELASYHYRSNGEWNCPVVLRMPSGGYIQGGPYHSQNIEAFLAHCPGLKVVIPSNAADAKRLVKTAIRDPNPVIILEHKALYRQRVFCARAEPGSEALLPFGQAEVVRTGSDVTLVAWGMMVVMGAEVADRLAQEGISVELIDLRTLVPLDEEAILRSVRKTGKLLIVHEAPLSGGFGAEIAARVGEKAFSSLDAPIRRLGGKECAVPYCKQLEDIVLPQTADLERELRSLARL